jgi:hypothetical protein
MSTVHRPDGDPNHADNDLRQDHWADVSLDDADALDAMLNEIAETNGMPRTRSGDSRNRPEARTDHDHGNAPAGSLAVTAASFHSRIETAQSRNLRAADPDPTLWETIMLKSSSSSTAIPAASIGNPWTADPASTSGVNRRPSQPKRHRKPVVRRQQTWNIIASVALVATILLFGFGVWRYYGGPSLPGGSSEPPAMPGVAMQPSALQSTPNATEQTGIAVPQSTPQPTTACDFGADIPMFRDVESSPIDQTSVVLSPAGDLVLTCPEEPEDMTLATGVASAAPGGWPGIVVFNYDAETPQEQKPAVINLLNGEIIPVGRDPEAARLSYYQPSQSPWLVYADADDPSVWKIADLRTMESRLFEAYGKPLSGDPNLVMVTANGDAGTLLVAQRTSSDDGTVIGDGELLVIDGSLDNGRWLSLPADLPPIVEIEPSPNGKFVALKGSPTDTDPSGVALPGTTATYAILDARNGSEISRSEAIEDYDTNMQWVQDGAALVYTQNTALMRLPAHPGVEPEALIEGSQQFMLEGLSVDPDVVLASVEPTEEHATVVPMGEEIQLYAVNTRTGDSTAVQGRDISNNVGWWEPPTRFLVMYEPEIAPEGPLTYPVVDAITGESVGAIEDVPQRNMGIPGVFYPDLGWRSVVGASDGNIEIIAFDTQHIYLMEMVNGTSEVRQISSPPGLLGEVDLTASMFLSPDGSMLSLTGDGDESRTRWLLSLDGEPDEWVEVPLTEPGEDPGYILFVPGTGD